MISPGETFRKALAKAIRRIPSEKETREAFERFRDLAGVFEEIREGRNGMRHEVVPDMDVKQTGRAVRKTS